MKHKPKVRVFRCSVASVWVAVTVLLLATCQLTLAQPGNVDIISVSVSLAGPTPTPTPSPCSVVPADATAILEQVFDVAVGLNADTGFGPATSFGFDVTYNPTVMSVTAVDVAGTLVEDWLLVNGTLLSPGHFRVGGFAGSGTPIDSGSPPPIVKLICQATLSEGTTDLCVEALTDGLSSCAPGCGIISILDILPGDLNEDGIVTPGDAQVAFECWLYGSFCLLSVGDVNCDGSITPGDAQLIFESWLCDVSILPCPGGASGCPEAKYRTKNHGGPSSRELRVGDAVGTAGDRVSVAVYATGEGNAISSFGMNELTYDTDLELVGIRSRDALTDGWGILESYEFEQGKSRVGGVAFGAEPVSDDGVLFYLEFEISPSASPGLKRILASGLRDGLQGFAIEGGAVRVVPRQPAATVPSYLTLHDLNSDGAVDARDLLRLLEARRLKGAQTPSLFDFARSWESLESSINGSSQQY